MNPPTDLDIELLKRVRAILAQTLIRGRQKSCGVFLDRYRDLQFIELLADVDRRIGNSPEVGLRFDLPPNLQQELRAIREYQDSTRRVSIGTYP